MHFEIRQLPPLGFFFNLFASTLEIILYTTLHKLISLNSEIFCGEATFGIRHINVSLREQGNKPEFKAPKTQFTTC